MDVKVTVPAADGKPRFAFLVEMFVYVQRHEDQQTLMAVCDDYAVAVGCAMRLMDEWGGWWRRDACRDLWEEEWGDDVGEDSQAIWVRRFPMNSAAAWFHAGEGPALIFDAIQAGLAQRC